MGGKENELISLCMQNLQGTVGNGNSLFLRSFLSLLWGVTFNVTLVTFLSADDIRM